MDLLTSLATNDEKELANSESTVKEQILKQQLRKWSELTEYTVTLSKGKYNLTTKAGQEVVGRNKQPDKGAGRQTWKCLD